MSQWADDRTVLVGRSTERAALRAALDDARRGRGRAVVLRGPPGIGKTALLDDAHCAIVVHGIRELSAALWSTAVSATSSETPGCAPTAAKVSPAARRSGGRGRAPTALPWCYR